MGEFLKNPLAEVRGDEGKVTAVQKKKKKKQKKGCLDTVGRLLLSAKWDGPRETPLAR
jgi:hypothetical protein